MVISSGLHDELQSMLEWLECLETELGLDLMLGLSTGRLCSLNVFEKSPSFTYVL